MKNLLLFCTFIANVCFMNAQQNNLDCATPESTAPDPQGVYSYSTDPATLDNCQPIVLNVKFWGINYPNGVNDFPNRPHDALEAIAGLNILYNEFGIYFKFRGYEEFDSPVVQGDPTGYYVLETTSQFTGLVNWAEANGYKDENALNVYAFGWATGFGGIAYMPGMVCGVNSGGMGGKITLHEISHNLNIRHTRSVNEHVTRDPNDPNFNADVAGDQVVDTAANPGFLDRSCYCYPYLNLNDCSYISGHQWDQVGVEYDIPDEDVDNLMGDAYPCQESYITVGQAIRAREKIATGFYDAALTDVASLYEPYTGDYYVDGTNEPAPPLFQPGFDYRFFECSCDCPEPSDFYDTSFTHTNHVVLSISKYETDYSLITHPNHTAINIDMPLCADPIVRRCYDNWNRAPKSGAITRFNDGIFNGNVTITPKDSLGINDPFLIDNLDQGLFKVEKNYEDGATQETVIFKED